MSYKEYTVRVFDNKDKRWYQNGQLHREDGPALEYADGAKEWWQNDQRHRLDGPAVEFINGYKEWFQNGLFHREDGPAIEYADGSKSWYIKGKNYSQEEFNKLTCKDHCNGKIIEIEGKKYKLEFIKES